MPDLPRAFLHVSDPSIVIPRGYCDTLTKHTKLQHTSVASNSLTTWSVALTTRTMLDDITPIWLCTLTPFLTLTSFGIPKVTMKLLWKSIESLVN
jgi:hypothetical protein